MPEVGYGRVIRYGVALACVVAATLVRLGLDPLLADRFPFATLFLAVLVAAWFGGFGPALAASALGSVLSAWLLLPPRWSVSVDAEHQMGLLLFFAVSVGVAVLGGSMHRTRRRALETIRRSEEQARRRGEKAQALFAAVVESSDDAIVTKTLEGIVTSWNAGAERLFGFSAGEAVGQSITIIYPRDRLAEERDILSRLRRGERIEHFETQRVARDGRVLDISLAISPLRDGGGQIVGASMVARDITARKRTEQALGESEERFRLLADNIAQFAWMANADGWIFWYNQRWFAYTGTTLEQMEGWGWQAVHHPDHVERVTEKFRRHVEAGEPWEDTFPLRSRAGDFRWFLSRAIPIRDGAGNVAAKTPSSPPWRTSCATHWHRCAPHSRSSRKARAIAAWRSARRRRWTGS